MARTNNLSNYLKDVATAIKTKKGDSTPINASNFDTEIASIQTGITPTGTISITQNGTYDVSDKSQASVNVPTEIDDYFKNSIDYSSSSSSPAWFYLVKKIPEIHISKSVGLNNAFAGCKADVIRLTAPSNITFSNIDSIFSNCGYVHTIDVGQINLKGVTNSFYNMFLNCNELTNLTFFVNLGVGKLTTFHESTQRLSFTSCTKLTHESLMDVINKLGDLSIQNITRNLELGSTNIAKLTAEEIAIATAKGWTVS